MQQLIDRHEAELANQREAAEQIELSHLAKTVRFAQQAKIGTKRIKKELSILQREKQLVDEQLAERLQVCELEKRTVQREVNEQLASMKQDVAAFEEKNHMLVKKHNQAVIEKELAENQLGKLQLEKQRVEGQLVQTILADLEGERELAGKQLSKLQLEKRHVDEQLLEKEQQITALQNETEGAKKQIDHLQLEKQLVDAKLLKKGEQIVSMRKENNANVNRIMNSFRSIETKNRSLQDSLRQLRSSNATNTPCQQQNESSKQSSQKKRLGKPKESAENQKLRKELSEAIVENNPNVKFDDVAGLKQAKETLIGSVIVPARFPQLFTGERRPFKGILLYGPPGTGVFCTSFFQDF